MHSRLYGATSDAFERHAVTYLAHQPAHSLSSLRTAPACDGTTLLVLGKAIQCADLKVQSPLGEPAGLICGTNNYLPSTCCSAQTPTSNVSLSPPTNSSNANMRSVMACDSCLLRNSGGTSAIHARLYRKIRCCQHFHITPALSSFPTKITFASPRMRARSIGSCGKRGDSQTFRPVQQLRAWM
jgi:hypothetical protein